MSQMALAVACEMSQQNISRIESGRQAVTMERAGVIAAALGTTVGALWDDPS